MYFHVRSGPHGFLVYFRGVVCVSSIHTSQRSTSSNHQSFPFRQTRQFSSTGVLGVAYRFHPLQRDILHHSSHLSSTMSTGLLLFSSIGVLSPFISSTRVLCESTWSACRKHAWLTFVHHIHPIGTRILGKVHLSRSNSLTHGPFGFPKSQVAVEFF